jgi:hypothetical protein
VDYVELVVPYIQLANESESILDFAITTRVLLFDKPTAAFPKKKFRPGSARVVYIIGGEAFGKIKQARLRGDKVKIKAAIASPQALVDLGYDMDDRLMQLKYMGAIVHELLEVKYIKAQMIDKDFVKEHKHANIGVLHGHGYFLKHIGVEENELFKFARASDLPFLKEGWNSKGGI